MTSWLVDTLDPAELTGRRMHLIRHAQPVIEPDVPPERWRLAPEGQRDALRLADNLRRCAPTRIWSSREPKAMETARILAAALACPTATHDGLREVTFAAGFLTQAEFGERVASFLAGEGDPAFEPYEEARRRIVGTLAEICRYEAGDIAVVSHGRILTVLLAELLGRRLGASAWRRIPMPGWTLIDLEHGTVIAGFARQF